MNETLLSTSGLNVTLRDAFAAFVLAGIVAALIDKVDADKYHPRPWADTAYELADAMLMARQNDPAPYARTSPPAWPA